MNDSTSAWVRGAVCALLAFLVVAAFWPMLDHGFVGYGDAAYVTENQHVQQAELKWAWPWLDAARRRPTC